MLCKPTALMRLVNAGIQEGLEAWRSLVEAHDPSSLARLAGFVQELLSFFFDSDISGCIAQYDRDVDRYERN